MKTMWMSSPFHSFVAISNSDAKLVKIVLFHVFIKLIKMTTHFSSSEKCRISNKSYFTPRRDFSQCAYYNSFKTYLFAQAKRVYIPII